MVRIGENYKNKGIVRDIVEAVDGRFVMFCEKDGKKEWHVEGDEE